MVGIEAVWIFKKIKYLSNINNYDQIIHEKDRMQCH